MANCFRKRGYVFEDKWLRDPQFRDWLLKKNSAEGYCHICEIPVNITYTARSALKQHQKTNKHLRRMKEALIEKYRIDAKTKKIGTRAKMIYGRAKLDRAMKAILVEQVPIKHAAKTYGIPYSTLYGRVQKKVEEKREMKRHESKEQSSEEKREMKRHESKEQSSEKEQDMKQHESKKQSETREVEISKEDESSEESSEEVVECGEWWNADLQGLQVDYSSCHTDIKLIKGDTQENRSPMLTKHYGKSLPQTTPRLDESINPERTTTESVEYHRHKPSVTASDQLCHAVTPPSVLSHGSSSYRVISKPKKSDIDVSNEIKVLTIPIKRYEVDKVYRFDKVVTKHPGFSPKKNSRVAENSDSAVSSVDTLKCTSPNRDTINRVEKRPSYMKFLTRGGYTKRVLATSKRKKGDIIVPHRTSISTITTESYELGTVETDSQCSDKLTARSCKMREVLTSNQLKSASKGASADQTVENPTPDNFIPPVDNVFIHQTNKVDTNNRLIPSVETTFSQQTDDAQVQFSNCGFEVLYTQETGSNSHYQILSHTEDVYTQETDGSNISLSDDQNIPQDVGFTQTYNSNTTDRSSPPVEAEGQHIKCQTDEVSHQYDKVVASNSKYSLNAIADLQPDTAFNLSSPPQTEEVVDNLKHSFDTVMDHQPDTSFYQSNPPQTDEVVVSNSKCSSEAVPDHQLDIALYRSSPPLIDKISYPCDEVVASNLKYSLDAVAERQPDTVFNQSSPPQIDKVVNNSKHSFDTIADLQPDPSFYQPNTPHTDEVDASNSKCSSEAVQDNQPDLTFYQPSPPLINKVSYQYDEVVASNSKLSSNAVEDYQPDTTLNQDLTRSSIKSSVLHKSAKKVSHNCLVPVPYFISHKFNVKNTFEGPSEALSDQIATILSSVSKNLPLDSKDTSFISTFTPDVLTFEGILIGLASYFSGKMLDSIETCTLYLKETINKLSDYKVINIYIRYFNEDLCKVDVKYLSSLFFTLCTPSIVICKRIQEFIQKLKIKQVKIIQNCIDGPKMSMIGHVEEMQEDDSSEKDAGNEHIIFSLRSFSRILEEALECDEGLSQWYLGYLNFLLNSLFHLFAESPNRTERFLKVSKMRKLPSKLSYKLVEKKLAAKIAFEIWEDIKLFVEEEKHNSCSSYFSVVKEACENCLTPVKLIFFVCVSEMLEDFVAQFQEHLSFLPYFSNNFVKFIIEFLKNLNIIKEDHKLDKFEDLYSFLRENISSDSCCIDIDLGFRAEMLLRSFLDDNKVECKQVVFLRAEAREFIFKICLKLLEESGIASAVVSSCSCFNPSEMIHGEFSGCLRKLDDLLCSFVCDDLIPMDDCEEIKLQYKQFLGRVRLSKELYLKDSECTQLDKFYYSHLSAPKYRKLWHFVKVVLLLFNGVIDSDTSIPNEQKISKMSSTELKVFGKCHSARIMISEHINNASNNIKNSCTITDEMRQTVSEAIADHRDLMCVLAARESRGNKRKYQE